MMQIMALTEVIYKARYYCTAIELLFEGAWWATFLEKTGLTAFHGLAEQAHNEMVRLRGLGVAWDYNFLLSKWEYHRRFEDVMHSCASCKSSIRMRPTLKNIILKRLKYGKWKYANLSHVDY